MKLFHDLRDIDWIKVSLFIACMGVFWLGLKDLVPQKYHEAGILILSAVQGALALWVKSTKDYKGDK